MAKKKAKKKAKTVGCELCGDFPAHIHGRCHPTAPLRMIMMDETTMEVRCYNPDCNRFIARYKVELFPKKERALTKDEFMTMPQEYFDVETDEEAGRIAQAHFESLSKKRKR
jgi:hypothetical protein